MIEIENEAEATTERVARAIAPLIVASDLLILSGGLGAGKTYFTRCLLYAMGLDRDERVTSPTFTLVHEYEASLGSGAPRLVLHADLYRLSDPDEVSAIGLLDRRHEGAILVVEWGRPFIQELGGDAIYLDLLLDPRRMVLSSDGARGAQIEAALQKVEMDLQNIEQRRVVERGESCP